MAHADMFEMHIGAISISDHVAVVFSNRGADHWVAALPELRHRLKLHGYAELAVATYPEDRYSQAMVVRLPPGKSANTLFDLFHSIAFGTTHTLDSGATT